MTIPTKTPLGNEELRSRTQRLGQRHRTILFLVDGRRPLAEVLSLAQQAGAATSHFEDLVRLGLVEVPAEPEPPPAPPEPEEAEALQVTSVELPVPAVPPVVDDAVNEEIAPVVAAPREARPAIPPAAAAPRAPVVLEDVVTPPPVSAAPVAETRRRTVPLPVLGEEAAVEAPVAAPPSAPGGDTDALQPVRELLIDTLRLDAPLFSARMFMRVRNAQSTTELIELTWEIQNHLMRARHAQRELVSLQRARELLGLGNTLVADDESRPPYLNE